MQRLFKYLCLTSDKDAVSDCAKELKNLKRMKQSYPPENKEEQLFINLKA